MSRIAYDQLVTTQTGVPIIDCDECGYRHPITRKHCPVCGLATLPSSHAKCQEVVHDDRTDR